MTYQTHSHLRLPSWPVCSEALTLQLVQGMNPGELLMNHRSYKCRRACNSAGADRKLRAAARLVMELVAHGWIAHAAIGSLLYVNIRVRLTKVETGTAQLRSGSRLDVKR